MEWLQYHWKRAGVVGVVCIAIYLLGFTTGQVTAYPSPPLTNEQFRMQVIRDCADKNIGRLVGVLTTPENMSRVLNECRAAFDANHRP